jgi:hypothetical protein
MLKTQLSVTHIIFVETIPEIQQPPYLRIPNRVYKHNTRYCPTKRRRYEPVYTREVSDTSELPLSRLQ